MIKKIDAFSIYCDECSDALISEYGGELVLSDASAIIEFAKNYAGWGQSNGKDLCPDCIVPVRVTIEEIAE